jgi:hypothetical protein
VQFTGGSSFPVTLQGSTPEDKSVTLYATKPSKAAVAYLTLTVYDPDFPREGELLINGNGPVELFGDFGESVNDNDTVTMTFTTPASWWVDGANELVFRHLSTVGFTIEDGSVRF